MDKIEVIVAMERMRDTILRERKIMPEEQTKAEQEKAIRTIMTFIGEGDTQRLIDKLKEEVEKDNMSVPKGSKTKSRATAVKALSAKAQKKFENFKPLLAGVIRDKTTDKDCVMGAYAAVILNNKAPEFAVKSAFYDKETYDVSHCCPDTYGKPCFTLSVKQLESIQKQRKLEAGKAWNSATCLDKIVVFGTEDKSVQFKVNIQYLVDVAKCIEEDDGTVQLYFTGDKKVLVIETKHGTGLVMPFCKKDDECEVYENDYVIKQI